MALKIEAQLTGDGTGFYRMMGQAELATKKLAGSILGPLKNAIAAAFSIGAIESLSQKTIAAASHFRNLADQLQVNVEWLQAMSIAARHAGASEDDLAAVLVQLNRARAAAAGGNINNMARFQQMGFTPAQVAGPQSLPLNKFFEKVANAFEKNGSQAMLPVLQELGIRSAKTLAAALEQGLVESANEVKDSGDIMAEDIIDALHEVEVKAEMLQTRLMAGVAPAIVWVIDKLQRFHDVLRSVGAWIGGFIFSNGNISQRISEANASAEEERWLIAGETTGAERMMQRRRRIRRVAETTGPQFLPPVTGQRQSPSDALTAVGNFLGGSGASGLQSLAQKTNQLLMKNNDQNDRMVAALETMAAAGDIGIPGGF